MAVSNIVSTVIRPYSSSSSLLGKRERESEDKDEKIVKKSKTEPLIGSAKTKLSFDLTESFSLTDTIFLEKISAAFNLEEVLWAHGYNQVTDLGIECLKDKASKLTRLDLHAAGRATAEALSRLINAAPLLRSIALYSCKQINDVFAQALEFHSHLETVRIGYSNNVTDHTVQLIAEKCLNLKELDLESCKRCTDQTLIYLSQAAVGLKKLCIGCCPQITDRGVQAIAEAATRLRELNLRSNRLS